MDTEAGQSFLREDQLAPTLKLEVTQLLTAKGTHNADDKRLRVVGSVKLYNYAPAVALGTPTLIHPSTLHFDHAASLPFLRELHSRFLFAVHNTPVSHDLPFSAEGCKRLNVVTNRMDKLLKVTLWKAHPNSSFSSSRLLAPREL